MKTHLQLKLSDYRIGRNRAFSWCLVLAIVYSCNAVYMPDGRPWVQAAEVVVDLSLVCVIVLIVWAQVRRERVEDRLSGDAWKKAELDLTIDQGKENLHLNGVCNLPREVSTEALKMRIRCLLNYEVGLLGAFLGVADIPMSSVKISEHIVELSREETGECSQKLSFQFELPREQVPKADRNRDGSLHSWTFALVTAEANPRNIATFQLPPIC